MPGGLVPDLGAGSGEGSDSDSGAGGRGVLAMFIRACRYQSRRGPDTAGGSHNCSAILAGGGSFPVVTDLGGARTEASLGHGPAQGYRPGTDFLARVKSRTLGKLHRLTTFDNITFMVKLCRPLILLGLAGDPQAARLGQVNATRNGGGNYGT